MILADRGLLDGSAYLSSSEFDRLTHYLKMSIMQMRDRYDAVIHLESAAIDAQEFYETMVDG